MREFIEGPWSIQSGLHYSNEITAKSPRGKTYVIARTTAAKVGQKANVANTRLIAAAPQLLEALKVAVSCLKACNVMGDDDDSTPLSWQPKMRQIRSAITSATLPTP